MTKSILSWPLYIIGFDIVKSTLATITAISDIINVSMTSSGKLSISMFIASSEISIGNTRLEEQVSVELIYEILFDNNYVSSQELAEFVNNEKVFLVLLILAIILAVFLLSGTLAGASYKALASGIAFLITKFK